MITYYVSLGGQLVANLLPSHAVGFTQSLVIPDDVTKDGADSIDSYIQSELIRLRAKEADRHAKLIEKIRASNCEIVVSVNKISIVGELRYTEQPRGLFTVRLVSPAEYQAEMTVFGSYARGVMKANQTHSLHGEWLPTVVTEAEDVLVRLYQDQLHRKCHARAYALVEMLQDKIIKE